MSGLSEFFDVVEHLVNTHPTWNQTLSKDEARLKVAAAKAEELAKYAGPIATDVGVVATEIGSGALPDLASVEKLFKDVTGGGVNA